MTSAAEAARVILTARDMRHQSGQLFAVPIANDLQADSKVIENAIQTAIDEAMTQGVKGKAVTPFILQRVNELTGGKSLETNVELVKNNAKVGAQIAHELTKLKQERKRPTQKSTTRVGPNSSRPVVIGGSNVDFTATSSTSVTNNGATYKGTVRNYNYNKATYGRKYFDLVNWVFKLTSIFIIYHCYADHFVFWRSRS